MTDLTIVSEEYIISGLSVIPVKADKRPPLKWETFQHRPADIDQLERLFGTSWGLAIISGRVSGGLETIDFDAHGKDIDNIFASFMADDGVSDIMSRNRIPVERSPRGGYHILYRHDGDQDGSLKLANWENGESMIETRGEGGYTVTYPSPGYTMISGDLLDIPTIGVDERDYLIRIAKSFSKAPAKAQDSAQVNTKGYDHTDPVSYFNWNCGEFSRSLLKEVGWVKLRLDKQQNIEYWQRPGKSGSEHSATWGSKFNALYVFSSSADPFKNECYYTPFQILVKLRFKGNYQAAYSWVVGKYFEESIPYIRIGIDYFKKITKVDRFGIKRTELKSWKKDEIKQDHGKSMLDNIPKYDDFTIEPDNLNYSPVVNNCYNLYREFPHRPAAGSWKWTEILLRHIFGDQYDLGVRYMQILYLHPDRLMPILVMVSKERQTGKTTFVNWLNMIFGDNMANINPEELVNGFNSSYASSNIIAVEETLIEKSITVEKVKALATQKFISVNQKFVSQYRMPFFGKIILTSNNEDKFARIDQEEIRFFIRKVGIPTIKNHNIEADMISEIPAFLHYLTTLPPVDFSKDRSGFTPDELANESLSKVKLESRSWLYKEIVILIEDMFMNLPDNVEEIYADPTTIKDKWFKTNGQVERGFIISVLKNEFNIQPAAKLMRFKPLGDPSEKVGRPYVFTREIFGKGSVEDAEEVIPF